VALLWSSVHVVHAGESDLRTAPYRSLLVLLEQVREQRRTIGVLVFLRHYHFRSIVQLNTLSLVSSSIVRLIYARATSAYTKTPIAFSIHKAEATQFEVVRLTPCTVTQDAYSCFTHRLQVPID
jgi:hypothetical protein